MMHYWNLLWDWNNLDSVRTVHSFLEGWALVFFALLVAFEALAHLTEEEHPARSRRFERIGLWFFGVAVVAEILAYPYSQRNDTLSEKVIGSLSEVARTADTKARQALGNSSVAITRSGEARDKSKAAQDASGKAVSESGVAKTSASNALVLARGARMEADTFEKDIVSAKEQAAKAEAHLAEALQRAANAEAQALKVRQDAAPRRLTEEQKRELVKLLSATPPFTVSFESTVFSGEVDDFADDLIDVFVRMKLMPAPSGNRVHNLGTTARGVLVGVLSEKQYPPAAEAFINALRGWGFEAGAVFPPVVAVKLPTEMRIWVAPKQ